jgi:hypothetical protein
MVAVTIAYALICAAFAAKSSRGAAVGILVLSTLVWPEYLRFPMGGVQMSAPRLVALILFFKYRKKDRKKTDKFNPIDKLIVVEFFWDIFANVMAGADDARIKWLIGRSLDTLVVYFAVRYSIRDKSDLKNMIVPLLLCGIILGAAGIYEAVTYHSPYQALVKYNTWMWYQKDLEYRAGFLRAQASTSHPIYFGMSLFILSGILLSLRGIAKQSPDIQNKKLLWIAGLCSSIVGAFSALSSGPILSTVLLLVFNAVYFKTSIIKPALKLVFALMLGMELLSNRHFYHLIEYLTLDKTTDYYRTLLLEVAVNQVLEYWLFGLGGVAPVHWGMLVDGRNHVDIVNNYVIIATLGGVGSFFMFLRIQILCFKRATAFWRTDEYLKIFGFGLACLILSFMLGTLSVGVFGPVLIFSYIVYGLLASPLDLKE